VVRLTRAPSFKRGRDGEGGGTGLGASLFYNRRKKKKNGNRLGRIKSIRVGEKGLLSVCLAIEKEGKKSYGDHEKKGGRQKPYT